VSGLHVVETPALKISKSYGQKAIDTIRSMSILSSDFKVEREQEYLYVPLIHEPTASELGDLRANLPKFEISRHEFSRYVEPTPSLISLLGEKLPPHVLASLPNAIDFIGDIAVVEIAPELEPYKLTIGDAVLQAYKRVKTVLGKWGAVSGVYRLRPLEVIGGERKTATIHKEFGCVFYADLAKVYFSPRLSYEHRRVASLVGSSEKVVDMFAGVGPFSILIAKRHRDVRVCAIDLNPDAADFIRKNALANRVEGQVKALLGDARQIVRERLKGIADRVIMNLPETAIQYVDVACEAVKSDGGIIHYYEFSNPPEPREAATRRLSDAVKQAGRSVEKVSLARIVRGIAPFTYHVAVDVHIK